MEVMRHCVTKLRRNNGIILKEVFWKFSRENGSSFWIIKQKERKKERKKKKKKKKKAAIENIVVM